MSAVDRKRQRQESLERHERMDRLFALGVADSKKAHDPGIKLPADPIRPDDPILQGIPPPRKRSKVGPGLSYVDSDIPHDDNWRERCRAIRAKYGIRASAAVRVLPPRELLTMSSERVVAQEVEPVIRFVI